MAIRNIRISTDEVLRKNLQTDQGNYPQSADTAG